MGVEKHWQTANGGLGAFEMRSTVWQLHYVHFYAVLFNYVACEK